MLFHRTGRLMSWYKKCFEICLFCLRVALFFGTLLLAGWYAVGSSYLLWLWNKVQGKTQQRYARVPVMSHAHDEELKVQRAPRGHADKAVNQDRNMLFTHGDQVGGQVWAQRKTSERWVSVNSKSVLTTYLLASVKYFLLAFREQSYTLLLPSLGVLQLGQRPGASTFTPPASVLHVKDSHGRDGGDTYTASSETFKVKLITFQHVLSPSLWNTAAWSVAISFKIVTWDH